MAKHAKKSRRRGRPRRTGRKKADTAKAPSSRAIEAALAGIAHDIRTPLTGIVALAELLVSSDLGAREREWATAIKSGADHLSALTTVIVDAAKANASGLVLRDEPFSPHALAEAVGAALAARAHNKDIKADVKIGNLPGMVSGDGLRLRAALENLADNAAKFTHEGKITFTASAEQAARGRVRLIFTFADNGIGISASELKQLFRPFAQASVRISKLYGGAGLGLSFVKRLAKAMGGDLHVTSKKGSGSTFRLSVLAEPLETQAAAKRQDDRPASVRPLSILCAEDNPYGRVVMNTILRELGHRVDFAETGEAVVAAVERGGYDAVLMDVMLTGLNGIEAARRVRALSGKAGQTPIIGISGRGESGDEAIARAAGMNFYFVKPVSPRKLAQALAECSVR
ncbi:MAG TPA: ATP-binding protein [Pseudolabrys sp.]|nr:ATP-binding protein [Pseudolabrys sp.]